MIYDIAIIGSGVVGSAIAQRLSRYDLNIVVLEKEDDVAMGSSKANTGIIHSGHDPKPGTLKSEMNLKGNPMFDDLCETIGVDMEREGMLVCATDQDGIEILKHKEGAAKKTGVPTEMITDKEKIKELEPCVSDEVIAVLNTPTAGIIIPFEFTVGLAEHAAMNGVDFRFNAEVVKIDHPLAPSLLRRGNKTDCFRISVKAPFDKKSSDVIESKVVINCAGLYSDKISKMVGLDYFKILPRRGEYILLDKDVLDITRPLFPTPIKTNKGKISKGISVSPTLHGNIMIGPNAEDIEGDVKKETTPKVLKEIVKDASRLVPNIPLNKAITNFAGIRAACDMGDFIIEATEVNNFINVAGIESPGLTSSPAIAVKVECILKDNLGISLKEKERYVEKRPKPVRLNDLSEEGLHQKILEDRRWGTIVCRCERVTEAEIVEACNSVLPSSSLDMIKRRLRPGMGRCQGGFCTPKVMKIISRERGRKMSEISKKGKGSEIAVGRTKGLEDEVYNNVEL